MNNATILDEILNCQRSPNDKSGLGYNKEVANFKASTSKKHKVSLSFSKGGNKDASQAPTQSKEIFRISEQGRHQEAGPTPQSNFGRETHSRLIQRHGYENVFNGHCFSCNDYGHKALDCRHYARKDVGIFHNILKCWRCNQVGHIAAHCHSMRCYSCSGFGHKSQDCWNSKRQSMRSTSYYMARRGNEAWKKDNVERMEAHKTSVEKPRDFQKWMKKIEHQDMNEGIQNEESLTFSEAYAGSCGKNCIYAWSV
jgi:hypothetical protein